MQGVDCGNWTHYRLLGGVRDSSVEEALLSCQVNVRLKPLGVDGGSNPGLLVRVLGGRALLSSELSAASHGGWFGPEGQDLQPPGGVPD